jgi:asparagine synthase (glutamine-hydrolysing)
MCGIAGIVRHKAYKEVAEQDLHLLISPIKHRGPDGSGTWLHDQRYVGFAHRRLSIIDLSENGKQPFHRADLGLSITFNGEIYNYIELKEQLSKKGYAFRTSTDTEVILAAYKEFGPECLSYFDGMFAFAIWDESRQELFCARDRFGEKPFYYYHDQHQFVFASEIKQLWSFGIKKKLSPEKVARFINYAEVMDDAHLEKTFYDTVLSLKAAHYMIC